MSDLELLFPLGLSALLGGLLGIEREWRNKSAGLRTNVLIAIGSTLFSMLSVRMSASSGGDPTRIAAQIVTGIGFLGAGAIMRTGFDVHGLTTAAMIWVNAAVGVAVGAGQYRIAIAATSVSLVCLILLGPVEKLIDRKRPMHRRRATDAVSSGEASGGPSPGPPGGPPRSRQQ